VTEWMRWIAPSLGHALRRSLLLFTAVLVVWSATVAFEGLPTPQRDLHRNEKLNFRADFHRGPAAFLVQGVFVALCAGVGRVVFRIRL
jgi:hypothetical protein